MNSAVNRKPKNPRQQAALSIGMSSDGALSQTSKILIAQKNWGNWKAGAMTHSSLCLNPLNALHDILKLGKERLGEWVWIT